mgnify:CR=1 FL=1
MFPPGGSDTEFQQIQLELDKQTDRGAALLAGAVLEWRVRQTLRSRIKVWDSEAEKIFGTDDRAGELGFTAQARMAYCLGLVGEIGLRDIEAIAKIRNRFAHQFSVRSFSEQRVRDICGSLKSPELNHERFRLNATIPSKNPRDRFIQTTYLIGTMMWAQSVAPTVKWPRIGPNDIFW